MPTDRPLLLRVADAQPDTATEAELIGVLERFSSAFADRDAEAVLHLFAPTDDIVVVTSDGRLRRGVFTGLPDLTQAITTDLPADDTDHPSSPPLNAPITNTRNAPAVRPITRSARLGQSLAAAAAGQPTASKTASGSR